MFYFQLWKLFILELVFSSGFVLYVSYLGNGPGNAGSLTRHRPTGAGSDGSRNGGARLEGSHRLRHSIGQGELLAELDVRSAFGWIDKEKRFVRSVRIQIKLSDVGQVQFQSRPKICCLFENLAVTPLRSAANLWAYLIQNELKIQTK